MIAAVEMICLIIQGDNNAFLVPLAESAVTAARCEIAVPASSCFMRLMKL